MTRFLLHGCGLLLALCLLAGCTTDEYARKLLERDTSWGKVNSAVMAAGAQMEKDRDISAWRQYKAPSDKADLDVWVMLAGSKPRAAVPVAGPRPVQARGTVLVIHGLEDSKVTYLKLARMLNDKGFDVVLADLRAHGRSGGKFVTYGALEREDMKAVMDHVYQEKLVGEPLLVFGVAMGGSVAIQYAALDPRVQGVLALAPYRDMATACRRFVGRALVNDEEFDKIVQRSGELGKFNPAAASAVRAAMKLRCPLILSHGGLDPEVPTSDSEAIFAAAAGPKELDIVPFASHIGLLFGREAQMVAAIEKLATGRIGATSSPAAAPATMPR